MLREMRRVYPTEADELSASAELLVSVSLCADLNRSAKYRSEPRYGFSKLYADWTDRSRVVYGDKTPLPLFAPVKNPVDRKWRRMLRANVDEQLVKLPPSPAHELLTKSRLTHPDQLAEGYWVVYDLPSGNRVRLSQMRPITDSFHGERISCDDLLAVLAHID